jgi:hypothetical protein
MTCYECTQAGRDDSAAIGMCSLCGLAVCANHATITPAPGKRVIRLVVVTRRLACTTCCGTQSVA